MARGLNKVLLSGSPTLCVRYLFGRKRTWTVPCGPRSRPISIFHKTLQTLIWTNIVRSKTDARWQPLGPTLIDEITLFTSYACMESSSRARCNLVKSFAAFTCFANTIKLFQNCIHWDVKQKEVWVHEYCGVCKCPAMTMLSFLFKKQNKW